MVTRGYLLSTSYPGRSSASPRGGRQLFDGVLPQVPRPIDYGTRENTTMVTLIGGLVGELVATIVMTVFMTLLGDD
jgi:hypothetical protein